MSAFSKARESEQKPTVIVAKTIKGKGISFMEDNVAWHGKAMDEKEYKLAIEELKEEICKNKVEK